MNTLDRYLVRGFMGRVAVMLFLLTGIYLLAETIEQSEELGQGGYGIAALAWVVALKLPAMAYEIVPFAVLLGTLLWLAELGRHNELTALGGAGLSMARLTWPLLAGGLFLAGLAFALGNHVAGRLEALAERYAERHIEEEQPGYWLAEGGIWLQDGPHLVHIQRVARSGQELHGVQIYKRGQGHKIAALIQTPRLRYREGQWHLNAGWRFATDSLKIERIEDDTLGLRTRPELLAEFGKRPERMAFTGLWQYIQELERSGQAVGGLKFTLWQKITRPLACAVMVLVAAPFAAASPRSGRRAGRALVGIALGLVFHTSNLLVGHLSAAGWLPPVAAAWLPVAGFGLLGGTLLAQLR